MRVDSDDTADQVWIRDPTARILHRRLAQIADPLERRLPLELAAARALENGEALARLRGDLKRDPGDALGVEQRT